jgi:hypothetical protein
MHSFLLFFFSLFTTFMMDRIGAKGSFLISFFFSLLCVKLLSFLFLVPFSFPHASN